MIMISPLAFCVHLASVVNTIYVHFAVLLRAATLPTVSPTLEAKARLSVENLSCSKVRLRNHLRRFFFRPRICP